MRKTGLASAIAAIALIATGIPSSPAFASSECTVPSGNAESSMVICIDAGTIISRAPKTAQGSYDQEIVTTIDPSVSPLTSSSSIVAPSGWTVSYFDGTSWLTNKPASDLEWGLITQVRATGPAVSLGTSGDNVLSGRTATAPLPASAPFAGGGGGDGWSVFFDDQDHVFNIFHHDGDSQVDPAVDCHTRTGESCGPGWPFDLSPFHTNYQSEGWVDNATRKMWFETNTLTGTGFACIDLNDLTTGPAFCGGSDATAFVQLGSAGGSTYGQTGGLAAIGTRLFTWESDTGNLLCMDSSLNSGFGAPCPGQPTSISGVTSAPWGGGQSVMAMDGKIYGAAGTTGVCLDALTLTLCAGWPITLSNPGHGVFRLPGADKSTQGICFIDTVDTGTASNGTPGSNAGLADSSSINPCFDTSGIGISRPASLKLYTSDNYNTYGKNPDVTGSRVYWASSWVNIDYYYCWDASLSGGAGAMCPNWPIAIWPTYTIQVDPANDNCLWTNAHSGGVQTWDAIRGTADCVTPPSTVVFEPDLIVPRMSCSSENPIRAWNDFSLTEPADSTYNTASLTVVGTDGAPIPGYTDVPLTGSRTVDLSGLDVAVSGQTPTFNVVFDWADSGTPSTPEATVTASGGQPELCITPFSLDDCSSTLTGADLSSAAVVAEGSADDGILITDFSAATTQVDFEALRTATCLTTLPNTGLQPYSGWPIGAAGMLLIGATLVIMRRRA